MIVQKHDILTAIRTCVVFPRANCLLRFPAFTVNLKTAFLRVSNEFQHVQQ
jgi:hypothetical protein